MLDHILEGQCKKAAEINKENLFRLMNDNKDTVFGKLHRFSEIDTIDRYKMNVPLTDYSYYRKYVTEMRSGKDNVLTSYHVEGYCKTSGTEGNAKYIPVTGEALSRYSDQSERYPMHILKQAGKGKRLYINIFRTEPGSRDSRPLLFSELYNAWLCEQGLLDTSTQAGGKELLFNSAGQDSLYAKVCIAFLTEDLVTIEAPFMYDILHFFVYMERNWKSILDDLRKHIIPKQIELSDSIRDIILSYPADTKRLNDIENECAKGFDNIALRLWKDLSLINGISSRAYTAEDNALTRYTGSVRKQHLCYCSSECYIGNPVADDDFGYVLMPNSAFFEFLVYGSESEETFLPNELEAGKLYEPVITNFSGLYRYCLGDIVKVTGYMHESPVFEFMFRKNQAINIAGEKMYTYQLEEAVEILRADIDVLSFCFGASTLSIPGYYFLIAVTDGNVDKRSYARLLDSALSNVNEDYLDLRRLRNLARPRFFSVSDERYNEIMNSFFPSDRHNKPIHVLKQEIVEAILKEVRSYET